MAAIGSIRKHGVLLLVIIGLALLAFILGDLSNVTRVFSNKYTMARIDGKKMDQTYSKQYEENTALMKLLQGKNSLEDNDTYQIHEMTWQQMLQDAVLDKQLESFITKHTDTKLIIIDTLQKVREVSSDYSYSNDYEIISRLKRFADNNKICMILVHHTRKQKSDDSFDMISGTNGLLGAADGAFVLQKEKRTANAATLEISGRDQQDQKLYLNRNPDNLIWELERTETELWKEPPEPLLQVISQKFSESSPAWQGSPTELVSWLGVDMKPNALSLKLNINAARLFNEYGIRYSNRHTHSGRVITLHLEQQSEVSSA